MEFDEFMRTLYAAAEEIRGGYIKRLKITRQWEDLDEDKIEVFELMLDNSSADGLEALEKTLEDLRKDA